MIEVEWANAPYFPTDSRDRVNLTVKFSHLDVPVPFTADSGDSMEHGREIHASALAGAYGEITAYVPPTPAEVAVRENPPLRASKMAEAVDRATHWDMMGDTTQATAWRSYYRELHALEQMPGWPLVVQWPIAPEMAA